MLSYKIPAFIILPKISKIIHFKGIKSVYSVTVPHKIKGLFERHLSLYTDIVASSRDLFPKTIDEAGGCARRNEAHTSS